MSADGGALGEIAMTGAPSATTQHTHPTDNRRAAEGIPRSATGATRDPML